MSFENLSLPIIGRYEKDNDGGGAWYAGDDDGCDTCSSPGLICECLDATSEAIQGKYGRKARCKH